MESDAMGRVLTEATIINLEDAWAARRGLIREEQVRQVTVTDALVDTTGATTLALPTRLIQQLRLQKRYEKRTRSSRGTATANVFEVVRVIIRGRDCTTDVVEVPDDVPVLIGQIPLEMMDYVVDLQSRQLIGNPAHNGEQMLEMY